MSGTPPWWRSKWRDDGVMMPYVSCSGVRLDASSGIVVGRKKRVAFSKRDRLPYGLMPAPSARGSAGIGFDLQAAIAAAIEPPTPRNQRRERDSLISVRTI